MRSLLGTVILVVDFSRSVLYIYPAIPARACRVSSERSAVKRMVFPLYVTYCFSLAAFNILSLYLVFVSLISMCLGVSPWVYPVWDSLCLLHLIDYFLFRVGEIFNYSLFKKFLIPFLFLLFFWDLYNLNVGVFDMVPEVSEAVLSSFHSFYFILLWKLFPIFYLPAHWFTLLLQIFCYWFLLQKRKRKGTRNFLKRL